MAHLNVFPLWASCVVGCPNYVFCCALNVKYGVDLQRDYILDNLPLGFLENRSHYSGAKPNEAQPNFRV